MKRQSRCHTISVTSHEKLLLAFYRSQTLERQRDIDGLLGRWWTLPGVDTQFRHEGRTLSIGTLRASHVAPFMDASIGMVGVERKAV